MKILTNEKYTPNESAAVKLFYRRSLMGSGDTIKGFKLHEDLITGLGTCDFIIADMYWKPIGDSLLFLSVLQAVEDYISIIRSNRRPQWVIDSKFSNLIKHISFLKNAKVITNATDKFKKSVVKRDSVLITDGDPFSVEGYRPVFNSEEYKYPKFYDNEKGCLQEYPSRPARYYLTFERNIGVVLKNPNESLPKFVMRNSKKHSSAIYKKYGFNIDSIQDRFMLLISQTSKVEKKYGTLRYASLCLKYLKTNPNLNALFLVNKHEESPKEWLSFQKLVDTNKRIFILGSEDFEELAYIMARCVVTIGNDTGFSHLAAMSISRDTVTPNPVLIVYPDHDYKKWSTGYTSVIPITTPLSEYLAENNFSIRRKDTKYEDWGKDSWAYFINSKKITKVISKLKILE